MNPSEHTRGHRLTFGALLLGSEAGVLAKVDPALGSGERQLSAPGSPPIRSATPQQDSDLTINGRSIHLEDVPLDRVTVESKHIASRHHAAPALPARHSNEPPRCDDAGRGDRLAPKSERDPPRRAAAPSGRQHKRGGAALGWGPASRSGRAAGGVSGRGSRRPGVGPRRARRRKRAGYRSAVAAGLPTQSGQSARFRSVGGRRTARRRVLSAQAQSPPRQKDGCSWRRRTARTERLAGQRLICIGSAVEPTRRRSLLLAAGGSSSAPAAASR
jgi:hypothetical protein